ncbi:hypothetical protein F511_45144 [Dorcoceras hygrometricum]|uniref:Uncharacterized protein n=1 Tax=Dorcoceras hygrometricum TaxID=472368 RepID=A0A2Z6ZXA7_9LAMI|nr:hypothetical protein F511_45144 [Dorcoceras hygrometricum]
MSLFDLQDPPLLSIHVAAAARRPPCAAAAAARLRRKIVSGQFDEENPFVLISSVLLVQADEGVSFLVVDRIGDIYRNLPRTADVIVTTIGARHKCQQESKRRNFIVTSATAPPRMAAPHLHRRAHECARRLRAGRAWRAARRRACRVLGRAQRKRAGRTKLR